MVSFLGVFAVIVIAGIIIAPFSIGLIVLRNKIKKCYENIGSKPFQMKKLYHILSGIIAVYITAVTFFIIELVLGLIITDSVFILLVEFAIVYLIAETLFALYVYLRLELYAENIR